MLCDTCYDRNTCPKRTIGGKHISKCTMYFPELAPDRPRHPEDLTKPEITRPPMGTRN